MPGRRLGLATLVLVVACGAGSSPAKDKALCDAVAADLVGSGLGATPSQEQARSTDLRLDARVVQVGSPSLHAAVVDLHSHLHRVETAQRDGDAVRAGEEAGKARADIRQIARRCSRSEADFLGS